MQRKMLLLAVCGLLSACTMSPGAAPASQEEQDSKGNALMVCLHDAARTLDDNKSPIDSIGLAISSECASQYIEYRETIARGMPLMAQNMFIRKTEMNQDDVKLASSIVLEERKRRSPEFSKDQASDKSALEAGLEAVNRGDGVKALQLLQPLADQGNLFAQMTVGFIYSDGHNGVTKDEKKANQWYQKLAERGIADAQFALAVNYEIGRGVPQDYVQAYKWLALASAPNATFLSSSSGARNAIEVRQKLAQLMSADQISEAQNLVKEWKSNDK